MPKCLKCEQELSLNECDNIDDAGYIEVSFHYGSRHDQCLGVKDRIRKAETRIKQLLATDMIQAYICDDCFEKFEYLFEGYSIIRTEEKRV